MNIDVKMADRILDTKLPTAVKLVYMVIVNHANAKSREAFPSWDTIARKASIGHGTVSKALKLLVERGFVTKYSSPGRRSKTYKPTDPTCPPDELNSPPDELNSPPDELLKSNRCTLKVHQMDTNIRIEQKKRTTTSTSMNEEDEDEFTLMFDEFWKAYPDNCPYKANREQCKMKYVEVLRTESEPRKFHGFVMEALGRWRKSQKWYAENGRFICAPLKWLEEKSWEIEPAQRVETEAEQKTEAKPIVPKKTDWQLCIEQCKNCTGNGCLKGVKVPPAYNPTRPYRPDECDYFSKIGGDVRKSA